jgi:hypothetical protein
MSSELKNKLLNFEATPPPQVWKAVAAELDDSALGFQFPNRLKDAAVAPPPAALAQIFATLDGENTNPAYAAALYQMEIQPPANAWSHIKKNLDIDKEAALPEVRRFAPFIKYAAAAAVAGVLFWAGMQFLNSKKITETAVASTTPAAGTNIENPNTGTNLNLDAAIAATEAAEEARSEAALEASKKVYASIDVAEMVRKARKTVSSDLIIPDTDPSLTVQPRGLGEMYETADEQLASTDKYIVLMTPDGKIIRMSKKLGNMVCCVSGEEQDEDCVDQMSKWRKQIAEHPKALSPGNFLDIVSLVNSLQED